MQEEWKPILDYPNYEVSSFGNVRNSKTGRILKPGIQTNGYKIVSLGIKNTKQIHRLVAETFLPNLDNKSDVDHIDRNRTNNMVTNLRWVTRNENLLNTKLQDNPLCNINKNHNGFEVRFKRNHKNIYFGWRKTLEEAIILRDSVLLLLRGDKTLQGDIFVTLRNNFLSGELQ